MIISLIIIYILIAILTFFILSKIDFFDEYKYNYHFDFPSATFGTSLFWIIVLPIIGIGCFFDWIGENISIWGYIIYERNRNKKGDKR